jgi:hypothetical protein
VRNMLKPGLSTTKYSAKNYQKPNCKFVVKLVFASY